jgi:hypothetical protein
VTQRLDYPIDGSWRQSSIGLTIDGSWFPQIRDEILNVGCSNVSKETIAKSIDQRLQPRLYGRGRRKLIRSNVAFFVDLSELSELQWRDGWQITSAPIE